MNDPRFDYLARNRDHIERVCIECVQQAVNEQAPDPIARVGELLLQQASNASTAPPSSASRIAELEKALTTATTQLATATTELATANARIAELEAGKGPVSTDAKRGSMPRVRSKWEAPFESETLPPASLAGICVIFSCACI